MSCMDRREFLKLLGTTILATQIPFSSSKALTIEDINPLAFISLINFGCFKCSVKLKGCIKIKFPKKVKVAPKVYYWLPVGFIENGRAWEIKKIPFASVFSSLISPLAGELSFIPKGTLSIYAGTGHQHYMKVYPHYFGFPDELSDAIATVLSTIRLKPICASCSIISTMEKIILPKKNINKYLKKYKKELKISSGGKADYYSILSQFMNIFRQFPLFPSELFFWTWMIEEYSIDRFTVAPFLTAVHKAIVRTSMPLGKFMCPYLTSNLRRLGIRSPKVVDLKFLCVGHWGYGYPRIGIVRHDDPIVAGLLAIARFHHLFSKTIKIIPYEFDYSKTRYQLYHPKKTGCFKPGEYFYDPIADKLTSIGSSRDSITDLINKGETSTSSIVGRVGSMLRKSGKNKRYTGIVLWYRFKKCCW